MHKITTQDIESLYTSRVTQLRSSVYNRIGDYGAAEDLVQDAFFKILSSGKQYQTIQHLENAINLSINNLIKDYKKTHRDIESLESVSEETLSANDPLKKILIAEKLKATEQAIDDLPARQRQTLRLRAHNDLSYEQIANKLSISTETVRSTLRTARNNLKKILKQRKEGNLKN